MSKRNILKNVTWGVIDFAALPVVAAVSYLTGESDKVLSVSKDLNKRLECISADLQKKSDEKVQNEDNGTIGFVETPVDERVDNSLYEESGAAEEKNEVTENEKKVDKLVNEVKTDKNDGNM